MWLVWHCGFVWRLCHSVYFRHCVCLFARQSRVFRALRCGGRGLSSFFWLLLTYLFVSLSLFLFVMHFRLSLLSCTQKFARYIVDRSQATELLLFTLQTLIREQALYDQSQREEQQADMDEVVTVEIEVDELRQKVCMLSF